MLKRSHSDVPEETLRRRARRGRTVRVFAALTVLAMIPPAVAWAKITDNIVPVWSYYGCGRGPVSACQTDNAKVYYYMDSGGSDELESGDRAVVRHVMATDYGPTDLAIYYDSTPKWSGSGETDIYYQEENVDDDSDGSTWCNDKVGYWKCDQHYIAIDGGDYSEGLTCHETGHAVGMVHGDEAKPRIDKQADSLDCMQTPVPSGQDLEDNSEDNINGIYNKP